MWTLLSLASAACTFDADVAQLSQNIQAAEQAYTSLDVPEFQRAMNEVDFMVPCLVEPLSLDVAADLHRIRAIGQYVDGKPDAVAASLLAARTLQPDFEFSTDVLPEGFELREQYEALAPDEQFDTLPRPAKGHALRVDGTPKRERPSHAATVVQVESPEGVATHYLMPDDPLPSYPGVDRRQRTLRAGALATGGAALAMYGGAWISREAIRSSTTTAELDAGVTRTRVLAGASGAFMAASLTQLVLLTARPSQARETP